MRLVFDDPALRALVVLGWGAAVFVIAPEAVALAYARARRRAAAGRRRADGEPAGGRGARRLGWSAGRTRCGRWARSLPLAVLRCLPLLATCVAPPGG